MILEDVANLGEKLLLFGWLGCGCRSFLFFFLEFHDDAQGDEYAEGDDEEVDDVLNEHSVVDGNFFDGGYTFGGGFFALDDDVFHVFQSVAAGGYGYDGHDYVVDERADDFSEGSAYDNTDCHVDDVAAHCKFLEVFDE